MTIVYKYLNINNLQKTRSQISYAFSIKRYLSIRCQKGFDAGEAFFKGRNRSAKRNTDVILSVLPEHKSRSDEYACPMKNLLRKLLPYCHLAMVAGGKISPICLGGEGMEQKPEEPRDGGATGGW